jgi:hypothetical protein
VLAEVALGELESAVVLADLVERFQPEPEQLRRKRPGVSARF